MKSEIRDNESNLPADGKREGGHDDTVHQACPSSEQSGGTITIWHRT